MDLDKGGVSFGVDSSSQAEPTSNMLESRYSIGEREHPCIDSIKFLQHETHDKLIAYEKDSRQNAS